MSARIEEFRNLFYFVLFVIRNLLLFCIC